MNMVSNYPTRKSVLSMVFILAVVLGAVTVLLLGFTLTAKADGPAKTAKAATRAVETIDLPNQGGLEPYAMAYNASNGYVYVTNNNTSDVSVINGSTVIARISVGANPLGITYNAGNNLIYVANENTDNVSVINGLSKVADIPVGNRPVNLAYNPKNNYVYVANTISDTVSVIDALSVIATVPAGNHPSVVVVNDAAASVNYGDVYVTNLLDDTVTVIGGSNGTTVQTTLPTGLRPTDLTFNPNSGYVYIANADDNSVTVIDSASRTVNRNFTVNTRPTSITADRGNNNAYVLNTGGDSLNALRLNGRALPQSYFKVGNYPRRVRVDPVTHLVYVANAYSDTITVLDGDAPDKTITITLKGTVAVGDGPQAIQIDPTNSNVYVGNRGGNSISILQGTTNIGTIPPQYFPTQVSINPNNGYAYVPMRGGNVVRVYSGTTMLAEVPVRHNPRDVAINPATNYAYIPNIDSNSVSVIDDTFQPVARVQLDAGPIYAAVDSANNRIYVANWYSDTVSVLQGTTLLGSVLVDKNPRRIALDPNTQYAYVVNTYGNTVSVLDGLTPVTTLAPGLEPRFVLYNPVDTYIYVSNKGDNTVSVFNGLAKVGDVPVGVQPEDMAVDGNGKVYVSNFGDNTVSIITATGVVATVPVGGGPEGLAVSNRGQVFVSNALSNTVSVIQGNTVIETYNVGHEPRSVAYNAQADMVFVANYSDATLSVLMPETPQIDFSGTPQSGNVPLNVQFTSVTLGFAPTAYHWDFGDGVTATTASPSHIYNIPGIYDVSLVVSDSVRSYVLTRTNYITALTTADFIGVPRSGDAPLTVQFTSTIPVAPTAYSWAFGDGGTATTANPSHTYASPGSYGVSFNAIFSGGSKPLLIPAIKTAYISVNPAPGGPAANFSADVTSGDVPLDVNFTAITTGTVDSWLWQYGDGTTIANDGTLSGNSLLSSHTYTQIGNFEVTLIVSNTSGSLYTVNKPDYIHTTPRTSTSVYLPLVTK